MRTVSPTANGGRRRVCSQRVIPGLVLYAHCVTHCQRGQATCVLTAGDSRSGSVCALCHPLPTGAGDVCAHPLRVIPGLSPTANGGRRRVCSLRVIPGLVLYAHCVTHCQRGQATCVLTAGDSRSGCMRTVSPTANGGRRRVCSQRVPGLVLYAHCVTHCQRRHVLTAGDSRSGSVCTLCHALPTGAGDVCAHSG